MDVQSIVTPKLKIKSTQLFVVAGTILVSLLISVLCVGLTVRYEVDTETADVKSTEYWKLTLGPEQNVWYESGIEELKSAILKKEQFDEVQNVIIFIAEGVNSEMLARARFKGNESSVDMHNFVWDTFPHLGILKSRCSLEAECDAFTLATALFGGIQTSKGLGGLEKPVGARNCQKAPKETLHAASIFEQAKVLNLRTGFVTTRSVAGPLLAGLYGHSRDTKWKCDGDMTECVDVAAQLLKSQEGRDINVIMGGGRQSLVSRSPIAKGSTGTESTCFSRGKRDLLQDWRAYKSKENVSFELIQMIGELETLNGSDWDYVLGVFANEDLGDEGPNLTSLVSRSLDVLQRKDTGYIFVADTAVRSHEVVNYTQILWALDKTIRNTFNHTAFHSHNTVLIAVFLDLNHAQGALNDILLYATGPRSHLFEGVHEESYMAHVISYCLKMGIFRPSKSVANKFTF